MRAHSLQNILSQSCTLAVHQLIGAQNLRVAAHSGSDRLQAGCLSIQQSVGAVLPHRQLNNHVAAAHRLNRVNETAKGHRITQLQALSLSLQRGSQIARARNLKMSLRVISTKLRKSVQQHVNTLLRGQARQRKNTRTAISRHTLLLNSRVHLGNIHAVVHQLHATSAPLGTHLISGRTRNSNRLIGTPQTHTVYGLHELRTPRATVIHGVITGDTVLSGQELRHTGAALDDATDA